MTDETGSPAHETMGALEHLTGRSRGAVAWIRSDDMRAVLRGAALTLVSGGGGDASEDVVARLRRAGASYEIEAAPGRAIWINRRRVERATLAHGDMIEFGETGPISRFRLLGDGLRLRHTSDEIVGDSIAYVRASRRPLGSRLARAGRDMCVRLVGESSVAFRLFVLVAIAALALFSYRQWRVSQELRQSVEQSAEQLEDVATAFARSRADALRPSDLAALRDELGGRVASNVERLEALERRSRAGARVVAEATGSVAFIQGAYSVRDVATDRMLRLVVGVDGMPLTLPDGQPLLSFEGEGPIAEIQFTGTGFFIENGDLVTNRHVALPWETRASAETYAMRGHEPVMLKLIVYLPGRVEPTRFGLVGASENADLALLRAEGPLPPVAGLKLAEAPPSAGEEIILMGYPTGMRSILAQSGVAFIEKLLEEGDVSFWNVAERLAADGLISPLASRGIVSRVGESAIVYDAETTYGGSGGPVLNLRGEVVAVNSLILPEFGGSNIGVPIDEVRALLENAPTASERAQLP